MNLSIDKALAQSGIELAQSEIALSKMILSASGWRTVFAEDGDEESRAPSISPAHRLIAAAAAKVFAGFVFGAPAAAKSGAIVVGRDTRPTGRAIADAALCALAGEGRETRDIGIAAAPEIMAYTRDCGAAGFIYISASHNPIGHNGIKFGLADGGVLEGEKSAALLAAFRRFMNSASELERLRVSLNEFCQANKSVADLSAEKNISPGEYKNAALAAYRDFSQEVISGFADNKKRAAFFSDLREGLKKRPLGIAADFNGSARTLTIDRDFFAELGAGFHCINDKPGEIVHRIVPEGKSLDPCCALLTEIHRKDFSVCAGYVPDCDGDRGNLVIWDERLQCARALAAQEVFALVCMAELACLVRNGELCYDENGNALTKVAVAVNDPTSLRVDRIARAFDVRVFRAEVGEANVVSLARNLRQEGYLVRILGEGSAGGVIIHPSAVRDPLDTLGAVVKLLALRENDRGNVERAAPFKIWCERSNQNALYREDFSLADIIVSLPACATTGAYEENALLKISTSDHALLKARYQKIFLREWEEKKEMFRKRYGISKWEARAYNGTKETRGISQFACAERGGLKIIFSGTVRGTEEELAFIWIRGSATEPVFRVMADAVDRVAQVDQTDQNDKEEKSLTFAGNAQELEQFLINWQRAMTLEADSAES